MSGHLFLSMPCIIFHYYLTRARSEPTSDPVKPLIGLTVTQSVSGIVHTTSEKLLADSNADSHPTLSWRGSCEQPVRSSIRIDDVCNNGPQCKDKSDEDTICLSWNCLPGKFKCMDHLSGSMKCIGEGQVCDGEKNCRDGVDELDCETYSCLNGFWKCPDNLTCIHEDSVCDNNPECPDNGDEMQTLCEDWVCTGRMVKCRDEYNDPLCVANYEAYEYVFCEEGGSGDYSGSGGGGLTCGRKEFKCEDNLWCIDVEDVCDG